MDTNIPHVEFAERRERARAMAEAKGMDGLLVCARGGGTLDRYGDVLYLSNYYSPFPYIPDLAGNWTARAHAFVILPVKGDPILITDVPNDGRIAMPPECIVYTDLVLESVVEALKSAGLENGTVGLVGGDVLPVDTFMGIKSGVPGISWDSAGGILSTLRAVKSAGEIALLDQSAKVGSRTIEAMMAAAVPGATHGDVVAAGQQVLNAAGGVLYNSFMASGRGGDDPVLVKSNFPTWGSSEPLQEGHWLRLGISGVLNGYYFDVSRSKAIGPPSNRQIDLFEAAIASVEAGIEAVRVGATAEQLAQAGLGKQEELGFEIKGVFSGLGHGIGLGWDSPWLAPGDATVLCPGMVLNFERTITQDGFLGDFEETVVVTEEGYDRLTDAQLRFW
ncbi:MAG: aminopeptidase P family protein [Rhodospirillales bacterium]|jgi:Xaa-Pro aminopeptidase|nr:aminopeptidase P family protein [Rhodospirillales bacterium]MBT4626475.1 aminopeptidase P family protein [Rhodospirillales bacterium]MBT5350352.1 aminopeptidase P family protein [Rhodospirillales bacterium]MBT5521787.1 aminopeptidase P family protein [Rhodospirillales bacterium]MBT6108820.1 aminopeptidase P family protein [Rhodospirillales bacterium]